MRNCFNVSYNCGMKYQKQNIFVMEQEYKYFAFISYNSRDTEWGKRIQRKLESYRMPATLCSERGWKRTPIAPVFFAPTDIQPGSLSAELQERLRSSRNLIVVCSPNSARSEWVGREIAFFHGLGRSEQIHFFIVDGVPHSGNPDTECFNPVLEELGMPEILGANIHEKIYRWAWINRERAYVQLVSKLLGVEFDLVWQRHKRMMIGRMIMWAIGLLCVAIALVAVWARNQPVSVCVTLSEASVTNANLPPLTNAVLTLRMQNETKEATIHRMGDTAAFVNIPRRLLGSEAVLTFRCSGFSCDSMPVVLAESITVPVRRDPSFFGDVRFVLWDTAAERPLANTAVTVGEYDTRSDNDGRVRLNIPLARQRTTYEVKAGRRLERDSVFMPCAAGDVIRTKLNF